MAETGREVDEGLCRCCLERGLFDKKENLLDSTAVDVNNISYMDILLSCYSINISFSELTRGEKFICDLCIVRLKDAYRFRAMVEDSQIIWEKKRTSLVQVDENLIIEEMVSDNDWNDVGASPEQGPLERKKKPRKRNRPSKRDPSRPPRQEMRIFVKPTHVIKYSYKTNLDIIERWYGTKDVSENKWKQFLRTKISLEKLQCLICYQTFCQRIPLNNHLNVHFPVYICNHCGKPFATKERISYHNRGHDIGEYKCSYCSGVFYNLMRFKRHLQKHMPNYSASCSLCPERFTVPYKKLQHMVEVHNAPAKPYKCDQCDTSFLDPRKVKSHIKRVHLKERDYVCSICGIGYHTNYEMKKHIVQTHQGEGLFSCNECNELFTSEMALKDHSKIHGRDLDLVMPIENSDS